MTNIEYHDLEVLLRRSPKECLERLASFERKGNARTRHMSGVMRGRAISKLARFDEASRILERTLKSAQSKLQPDVASDAERALANICIQTGETDNGIRHARRAIDKAILCKSELRLGLAYESMACLLSREGEDSEAIKYHLDAITLLRRVAPVELVGSLNNLSYHYSRLGDHQHSKELLTEAIAICPSEDSVLLTTVYLNLSRNILQLGELDAAETACIRSLTLSEQYGNQRQQLLGQVHLVNIKLSKGESQFDDYQKILSKALSYFINFNDLRGQFLTQIQQGRLKAREGDFLEALSIIRHTSHEHESDKHLWETNVQGVIEEINRLAENWADAYTALQRVHSTQSRMRATSPLVASLSLLRGQELRNDEPKTDTTGSRIDEKLKELARVRDLAAEFRIEIQDLLRKSDTAESILREIKAKLVRLPVKLGYEILEADLLSVHPEFVARLTGAYPNLNLIQIRICFLSRLDLSASEAAGLLHISERTLENNRYRLRKLFGLRREEKLSDFLQKF
jgi:tetratricopeptide (TPR) repeat protein